MEKITIAVIGGGAAGLFLATALKHNQKTVVFERGERVGRKLSATGNGQGNVSNLHCTEEEYFSHDRQGVLLAQKLVSRFDFRALSAHFQNMGLLLAPDSRGRIYPTGKQASSLTDALRFSAAQKGVELRVNTRITEIDRVRDGFILTAETPDGTQKIHAKYVVLCSGGKAAKNFGTDGSAYALAQKFGHTLTPLTPSLVQLKTDTAAIKTLKGVKISDASVTARWQGGEKTFLGDLLFTDYGVSGDSIFRLSAYCADKIEQGVSLHVDSLPDFSEKTVYDLLVQKREIFPQMPVGELLGGIVNNQLGRSIMKIANGDLKKAAKTVKDFTLKVNGSLGFDYAQVTKGGVRTSEIDEDLQSKKTNDLYFAGEILDIDGPCGGFNLQWAYASACTVAASIDEKIEERRGAGMSLLTLSDIKLPITASESELVKIAEKKLGGKAEYFAIKKKSLDARDKNAIKYVYTIEYSKQRYTRQKECLETLSKNKLPQKPVMVVGSGPAGLFCALRLLDRGITPIVIERGAPVEEREKDNQTFFTTGKLNTESNVQFGEGGAGTFSDGKLNTQTHSALNKEVLETFVRYGAPAEIAWLQKPHIGSDNLKRVVKNMREEIVKRGGQVRFHTRLSDISVKDGVLQSVCLQTAQGEEIREVSALVVAIGHSARDTFETLYQRGVFMRQKDFALGVRVEHLQKDISFSQYGKAYTLLPAADYKLVSHTPSGRAAFTFCMCPGGFVMPAASEQGGVVTNGMSNYARDGMNANAALIAQVTGADFGSEHPLAGVEYQRKLERAAYVAGGKNYRAPTQLIGDFLRDKESTAFGEILPTYAVGTTFVDLRSVLPKPVVETLKIAISFMDGKLKGFARPDAILTGVETRTSSPLRMEREEKSLQSVSVQGLFPCGEGAGYAGGITSSAADGLRVADAVYASFL